MAKTSKRTWITQKGEKRVGWRVTYVDNAGNRQQPQFPNKRDADVFRVKIEDQLARGTYRPAAAKITVREVCEAYLEHCAGRFKRDERMTRKMLVVYKGHVENHVLQPEHGIGRNALASLTPRTIGDFRDRIRDSGVTVPTTRKVLATLHAIIEFAISQDWVATNVVRGIKVIGSRVEGAKKIEPPSKLAMKAIIDAADPDTRLKILVAAATGLRAGEQWGLRWADIDFEARELSVARRIDSYGCEGPPKSVAGVRSVPLSNYVVKALKEWRLESQFSKPDDFIFPNHRGRNICHDNLIKRWFKPALKRAGVSGVTWHSLRHFAISTWIEAGLAPKTVMTFAGHSSIQVTMDRYGHMFPSDDHQVVMDNIAVDLLRI